MCRNFVQVPTISVSWKKQSELYNLVRNDTTKNSKLQFFWKNKKRNVNDHILSLIIMKITHTHPHTHPHPHPHPHTPPPTHPNTHPHPNTHKHTPTQKQTKQNKTITGANDDDITVATNWMYKFYYMFLFQLYYSTQPVSFFNIILI